MWHFIRLTFVHRHEVVNLGTLMAQTECGLHISFLNSSIAPNRFESCVGRSETSASQLGGASGAFKLADNLTHMDDCDRAGVPVCGVLIPTAEIRQFIPLRDVFYRRARAPPQIPEVPDRREMSEILQRFPRPQSGRRRNAVSGTPQDRSSAPAAVLWSQ